MKAKQIPADSSSAPKGKLDHGQESPVRIEGFLVDSKTASSGETPYEVYANAGRYPLKK